MMTNRSWDEIENSKNEYEQKASSFFSYLEKISPNFYDGSTLKSYLEKSEQYYTKYYASEYSGKKYDEYERKLRDMKNTIDDFISKKGDIELFSNYEITAFLQAYARMKQLEKMVKKSKQFMEEQERIREKQESIKKLFGDFSAKKKITEKKETVWVRKTSQELINERNTRLAILNDLHHNNMLADEEFLNYVKAVSDSYTDEISNSIDEEVATVEKEPSKISKIIDKVKNFFHLGKPVEEVESQDLLDAKKIVNNFNAGKALTEASKLAKGQEKNVLLDNAIYVFNQTPVVENSEVSKLFAEMFQVRKNLATERYKNDKEMLASVLNSECEKMACMMSPMKISGNMYVVKSKEYLQTEEMQAINFLLKKYKHEQKFNFNAEGKLVEDCKFENVNAQKLYEEVCKVYATLRMQRENCVEFEKTRLQMSRQIANKGKVEDKFFIG